MHVQRLHGRVHKRTHAEPREVVKEGREPERRNTAGGPHLVVHSENEVKEQDLLFIHAEHGVDDVEGEQGLSLGQARTQDRCVASSEQEQRVLKHGLVPEGGLNQRPQPTFVWLLMDQAALRQRLCEGAEAESVVEFDNKATHVHM